MDNKFKKGGGEIQQRMIYSYDLRLDRVNELCNVILQLIYADIGQHRRTVKKKLKPTAPSSSFNPCKTTLNLLKLIRELSKLNEARENPKKTQTTFQYLTHEFHTEVSVVLDNALFLIVNNDG